MLLVFVLFFSLLESIISINAVVSVQLAFLIFSSPKTKIGTYFYRILCTKWMKSRDAAEEYRRKEPLRRLLLQSLRLTTPPLPLPAAGEVVYLPILMGYRSCYKRNMLSLGLHTKVSPAVFTIDIVMMGDSRHGPAGQVGRIRDNHPQ